MSRRRQRNAPPVPSAGRVVGFDVGEVRVGVAITDPHQLVATPSETLQVGVLLDEGPDDVGDEVASLAAALAGVADRHEAVGVVVGLPVNLDGREGRAARAARTLGDAIGAASGLPVHYVDERFTSVEAERAMAETGMDSRARRGTVDEVAASLILRAWLEARR